MSTAAVPNFLDGFRRAQRLAYDAALEVAAELAPGVTEKVAAKKLGEAIGARGVRRYFHTPFAWFGERTRFQNFGRISRDFFPSEKRLGPGMMAILDVAPIVDGFTADIGYTFACGGPTAELQTALATLREVRALIPECVQRGDTMRSIYVRIDRLFAQRGYDNRHSRYPFGVLGHRVEHVRNVPREPRIGGFGVSSLGRFALLQLAARVMPKKSPLWSNDETSNRPVEPGLWAIEPHLGGTGFGAKFEELLVVEPGGRAFWLDDDLPHVKPLQTPTSKG